MRLIGFSCLAACSFGVNRDVAMRKDATECVEGEGVAAPAAVPAVVQMAAVRRAVLVVARVVHIGRSGPGSECHYAVEGHPVLDVEFDVSASGRPNRHAEVRDDPAGVREI